MHTSDIVILGILLFGLIIAWAGFCATFAKQTHLNENQTVLLLILPILLILLFRIIK